jgi:hypothetical protein
MAAVICKTLGEIISATCRAVSIPCRALNFGCESLGDVIKSPFFLYLAVTFGLNLPPVVFAIRATVDWCSEVSNWVAYNGVLALIHMAAAMYITKTIRASNEASAMAVSGQLAEEGQYVNSNFSTPKADQPGAANSCERLKHVLCYDKVVALYICVFIGWVFWLAMGINLKLNSDGLCDGEQEGYLVKSVTFGYLYMCLCWVAFAFSLCCLR